MPMINFVQEVLGGPINKAQDLQDRDRMRVEKLLRQAIISSTHRSDCKPRHRVMKLSRTSAENTKFMYNPPGEEGNGKEISVAQYFKAHYNKPLQYPKLPCLVVGSIERHTFLPMEVAFVESAQKYRGKLDERQTADVIKISAKKPQDRKSAIESLSRSMLKVGESNEYTNAFGVNVDARLMEIDARILPAPRLLLGANKTSAPRDGAWNFINYQVVNPAKLTAVGVCCLDSRLRDGDVKRWIDNLFKVAGTMGLGLENGVAERYPLVFARGPGLNNVESTLKQAHAEVQKTFNQAPQLIICILSRREVPTYAKVKSLGDTQLGVPTQCMVVNKLQRANDQYFANVVLKINVKVTGPFANFKLNPREYFQEPTMLLGCDVTHPAPGTSQPSIAAMVGSTTPFSADRFSTVVRVVKSRQEELSEDVTREMFAKLLRTFYVTNGNRFPARIMFFRDGVSEGQFEAVHRTEVTAIRAVLEKAGAKSTKLTFLLVQKRHHTRFFATNPKDTDRTGNLKAGVVVERGVSHPTDYDFFLQSQAGLQGTARPTRYFVLYDEIKWQADQLQQFCYHLCYTYARCTRSVSVSPPAYYAHLACFRARHHLQGANMDGSETSMASHTSGPETLSQERLQQFNVAVQPKDSLTHSMFFM
jgi:eukaryotic translation initiation factor 2C